MPRGRVEKSQVFIFEGEKDSITLVFAESMKLSAKGQIELVDVKSRLELPDGPVQELLLFLLPKGFLVHSFVSRLNGATNEEEMASA